jgi:recombination protein RecA
MANSKVQDLISEINGAFKSNVLTTATDPHYIVEYLPTGLVPIDLLLHGGLPRGRFVEVYGDFSTLKSYIGYHAIAETQRNGGICALIDSERSFDPKWATAIGVNVEELLMPNREDMETGEQAIDMAETLVRTKHVDLIVIDSIAAMLPQAERNKRLHDESNQPARLAALMSLACRKITAANSRTSLFWINQTRENIGVTFGSPVTTSGGKAMGFYASYRLQCKKTGKITRDIKSWDGNKSTVVKEQIGQKIRISVEKSKLSRPFRDVNLVWDYQTASLDLADFLTSFCLENGIVKQTANTLTYGDIKSVGRDNFKKKVLKTEGALESLQQAALATIVDSVPATDVVAPAKPRRVRKKSVPSGKK